VSYNNDSIDFQISQISSDNIAWFGHTIGPSVILKNAIRTTDVKTTFCTFFIIFFIKTRFLTIFIFGTFFLFSSGEFVYPTKPAKIY